LLLSQQSPAGYRLNENNEQIERSTRNWEEPLFSLSNATSPWFALAVAEPVAPVIQCQFTLNPDEAKFISTFGEIEYPLSNAVEHFFRDIEPNNATLDRTGCNKA